VDAALLLNTYASCEKVLFTPECVIMSKGEMLHLVSNYQLREPQSQPRQ
jgi:hypothetical protein